MLLRRTNTLPQQQAPPAEKIVDESHIPDGRINKATVKIDAVRKVPTLLGDEDDGAKMSR